MRCLYQLVATALSLVTAVSLVDSNAYPQAALGHILEEQPQDPNNPSPPNRPTNSEVDDLARPGADAQNDDSKNPFSSIEAWLDNVAGLRADDGAILASSLFETSSSLTTSVFPTTTAAPPQVSASDIPSARVHTIVDGREDGDSAPLLSRPTSIYFRPTAYNAAQKPIGSIGRVWTSAQNKLKALSKLLCPLEHERQSQQHQQHRLGFSAGGFEHYISEPDPGSRKSPEIKEQHPYYHQDHQVASSRILPSRAALTTRASLPTNTAVAAAVLTATASISPNKAPTNIAALPANDLSDLSSFAQAKDKHLFAIFLSIMTTIFVTYCIFIFLQRRNPRRRVERLAAWEECVNRRTYARAAFAYRLRSSVFGLFGKFTYVGAWLFVRKSASDSEEKEVAASSLPQSEPISIEERFLREVHGFRQATEQIESLIRAEEGAISHSLGKHERRNQRRTYTWLFGRGARRPRANSTSESDCGSERSEGEKSGMTPPPPYADRELYVKIPDIIVAKMTVDAPDVSDRSSISSHVPTSPKEGSMTLGSLDGDSVREAV